MDGYLGRLAVLPYHAASSCVNSHLGVWLKVRETVVKKEEEVGE